MKYKVAMRELLNRIDKLRITDPGFEVSHPPSMILRGIKSLPVSLERVAASTWRTA